MKQEDWKRKIRIKIFSWKRLEAFYMKPAVIFRQVDNKIVSNCLLEKCFMTKQVLTSRKEYICRAEGPKEGNATCFHAASALVKVFWYRNYSCQVQNVLWYRHKMRAAYPRPPKWSEPTHNKLERDGSARLHKMRPSFFLQGLEQTNPNTKQMKTESRMIYIFASTSAVCYNPVALEQWSRV